MNKQLMERFLARRRKMLKEAAEEKLTKEDTDDFFTARDKQVRKRVKREINYGDYGDYDMERYHEVIAHEPVREAIKKVDPRMPQYVNALANAFENELNTDYIARDIMDDYAGYVDDFFNLYIDGQTRTKHKNIDDHAYVIMDDSCDIEEWWEPTRKKKDYRDNLLSPDKFGFDDFIIDDDQDVTSMVGNKNAKKLSKIVSDRLYESLADLLDNLYSRFVKAYNASAEKDIGDVQFNDNYLNKFKEFLDPVNIASFLNFIGYGRVNKKNAFDNLVHYLGKNYEKVKESLTELDEGCRGAARRRKMLREDTGIYDKINNYLIKIGEDPLDGTADDIEEDFSMEDDILDEAKADISLRKGTLGKKGVKQLLAPYKNELKNIFNRWFKYCGSDFIGPLIRRNVVGMPIEFDLLGFYMLKLLARATKTNTETVCDALNKEGLEYITDFVAEKTQKLFGSSYGDSNFPKTSQITQKVINEVKALASDLCGSDSALKSEFLSEWKKYIKNYRKNDMADDHKRRAAKLPENDPLLDESFKRIKKPANLLESLNRGFEQIYGSLDDNKRLTEAKETKKKYPIKEFFVDHMDELNKIMNNKKSSEKQKKQEILDLLNSSDVSKAQVDQFARKMEATHDWGFYGFIGTYITAQKVNES